MDYICVGIFAAQSFLAFFIAVCLKIIYSQNKLLLFNQEKTKQLGVDELTFILNEFSEKIEDMHFQIMQLEKNITTEISQRINWISLKKRLPSSTQFVYLMLIKDGREEKGHFNADTKEWTSMNSSTGNESIVTGKISHWKPMAT